MSSGNSALPELGLDSVTEYAITTAVQITVTAIVTADIRSSKEAVAMKLKIKVLGTFTVKLDFNRVEFLVF